MRARLAFAFLSPALCLAPQALAYDSLPKALARLSPAEFAESVKIVDDPLEPAIVLSSQQGYKRARSLKGASAEDVHLRALIDRGTGKITWQVWHELAYVGGRKTVDSIHYLAGGAVRQTRPFHVDHWLDGCPPTDSPGQCSEAMRVGFELPEAAVREIAETYSPGSRSPWRLRFKDAGGRDVTGGLAPAEAAGMLHAVDEWRSASKAICPRDC